MNKVRLGDVSEVITKGTTPTSIGYDFQNSGINFIKIESIAENGSFLKDKFAHISVECNESLKRSQLRCNDLLFSIAGAIGRVAIVDDSILPANTNQALAIIRIPKGIINYNYLYYFLKSEAIIKQYSRKKQGVAQINLSLKDISDLMLSVPSLSQQNKIVKVLSFLDELIKKANQQKEKLDELIKSRFVEMFGDFNSNPYEWNTVSLEQIADVGSSKRVFVEELKETGIPFYRGTEVGRLSEGQKIKPELFITEEHYQELIKESGKPQKGDLLMPSICPDGRIWLVDTDMPFYFKDGRVLWVHNISNFFNSTFLLYTLKDRIMTDYLSVASGTTFAELKIFALKKCKVFDVPLDLQVSFEKFINSVNRQKATVQQSIDKLETLKKSLMQEYFG